MSLMSWGMYPKIKSNVFSFGKLETLKDIVSEKKELIPYGNGRSYGDSALSTNIINVKPHNFFLNFDESSGLLHVESGVLLSEIVECFIPRGWFLKITPGTKYITVGGAIASDVHGKNHHLKGCFSECIKEFRMMLADTEVVTCSRETTPDLFKATCGGQGLTGIILDAQFYLQKINSKYIEQTTIKTRNLKETFEAFEEFKETSYSVAWIDCLAKSAQVGKGLLMVGEFKNDGNLDYHGRKRFRIPFHLPSFALNNLSVKTFNWLYYRKVKKRISNQKIDIDTFFYPLDMISQWNRIYGKKGFTQYQFILPKESSYKGLQQILEMISVSGKGSFLAVLKLYGKANDNFLSFPMKGYSLALDFKIEDGVFELLNELDKIVIEHKGRIYLTKDARVNNENFAKGYPNIQLFKEFRRKNNMNSKFGSLQSKRVGI